MKENIISNISDPKELEKLYRQNPPDFRREFNLIYPGLNNNLLADFWNERLNYESSTEIPGSSVRELTFVIIASLIAVIIAKIPEIFSVDETFFYMRNTGLIFLPVLAFYFAWKNSLSKRKILMASAAVLVSAVYINLLPVNGSGDTLKLSCIHLPLFLWTVLGFAFAGDRLNDQRKRLDFLRYNGDLIVISGIMIIAGMALTVITQGLFTLIGLKIFEFYRQFIIIPGLAALPIIGTYIIGKVPHLVSRVSPLIARIFSPLVLITLIAYLTAIIITGKDPYNDREFLLIFNVLLIAVMAIIVFSVAEISRSDRNRTEILILFLLSVVTVIVNCIALSAIIFRISEWGITPNRLAVLGGNVLILTNLILVIYKLFRTLFNKSELEEVEMVISKFLTVYCIWTVIVVFIFPPLFNFR